MAAMSWKEALANANVVANEYRTSVLNKLYYGYRLKAYSRRHKIFEICIAVGTGVPRV